MNPMNAYHGKTEIKSALMEQLNAHAAADEIIKGQYWEGGKGCSIGCMIHGSDHAKLETDYQIPQMVGRLADVIFEGLPNGRAKQFALDWPDAIKVGADRSKVGIQFQIALQERNYERLDKEKFPEVEKAIQATLDVLRDWLNEKLDKSAAESAESAAWSARATASAAWSAASAAWSAASAAREAAREAREAREAAWSSVTAWSARAATSAAREAAWSAREAARAEYIWMADKLIELLEAE